MQEALRQQMLQAMGQQVLVPRFVLPNAKPSTVIQELDGPEEETIPQALSHPKPCESSLTETVGSSDIAPVEKPSIPAFLQDALQAVPEESVESADSGNNISPYRHRLIIFSGIMFLLDQPSVEWHEEKEHMQFLHNIFQAVTQKRSELILQERFEWPPGKGLPLAGSEAKGIEQAFLTTQAEKYNVQWLIICGEKAASIVLDEQAETSEAAFIGTLNTLLMHDAQYYFEQPANKRILWQSLQVVCQSFKNE